jgi:hypothetical protein
MDLLPIESSSQASSPLLILVNAPIDRERDRNFSPSSLTLPQISSSHTTLSGRSEESEERRKPRSRSIDPPDKIRDNQMKL